MKTTEKVKHFLALFVCLGIVSLTLSACPKKQTVKKTVEEEPVEEESVESQELDTHGKDFVANPNLETIYFEYDSSELKQAARDILAKNADYLKKNLDLQVLTEGHTDERGTVSYNLALGQKRAASVRRYYISLGLPPKRVGSLSYGKEKPACMEGTEECWAQNRRVETKVRSVKVAADGHGKEAPVKDETR